MKETTVFEIEQNPLHVMEMAQQERILITREGKPIALLIGLEDAEFDWDALASVGITGTDESDADDDYKDEEDRQLERSPSFWRMIAESRQSPTVPLDEAMSILFPPLEDEPEIEDESGIELVFDELERELA